jgi:hypothetical protein
MPQLPFAQAAVAPSRRHTASQAPQLATSNATLRHWAAQHIQSAGQSESPAQSGRHVGTAAPAVPPAVASQTVPQGQLSLGAGVQLMQRWVAKSQAKASPQLASSLQPSAQILSAEQ